jgi:hypothetical protein
MQVVGHHHGGENSPMLELTGGCFKGVKGGVVCQDGLAMLNAHRDEINHALFPW